MQKLILKSVLIIGFLATVLLSCTTTSKEKQHAKSKHNTSAHELLTPFGCVNPFVGTGGHGWGVGSSFPGAKTPFGMVAPSPDTTFYGFHFPFYHCSGYYYGDVQIRGFSQTHLHGTGAGDYGAILIMPINGFDNSKIFEQGYRSRFSHHLEYAEPGYYSVLLLDPDIFVEITAT
ncbi:MAG: hypothetical protein QW761_03070, partial [Candidatus Aenigmatarchaeota archaeon]